MREKTRKKRRSKKESAPWIRYGDAAGGSNGLPIVGRVRTAAAVFSHCAASAFRPSRR